MRATTILAALLVVGAAVAGGDGAAEKKVLKQLQGEWKLERAEQEGKPVPADKIAGGRLRVEGDQFTVTKEGEEKKSVATVKLDASKKPFAIDITQQDNPGKTAQGILQLEQDGQVLKITFAPPGRPRPTEITPQPGEPVIALEFQREKK